MTKDIEMLRAVLLNAVIRAETELSDFVSCIEEENLTGAGIMLNELRKTIYFLTGKFTRETGIDTIGPFHEREEDETK